MAAEEQNVSNGKNLVIMLMAAGLAAGQSAADIVGSAGSYGSTSEAYRQNSLDHAASISLLVKAREQALAEYRRSPEYQAAVKAVDDAHKSLSAARARAGGKLSGGNPGYRAAVANRDAAQQAIDDARASQNRDSVYLNKLYNDKAKWNKEVKRFEDDVLEDTGDVALERAWREATTSLQKLEAEKADVIENSPKVLAARQKEESARAAWKQSGVEYAGARAQYLEESYQQAKEDWYRAEETEWLRHYPPYYQGDNYRRW
jgi:hypothetical protein